MGVARGLFFFSLNLNKSVRSAHRSAAAAGAAELQSLAQTDAPGGDGR